MKLADIYKKQGFGENQDISLLNQMMIQIKTTQQQITELNIGIETQQKKLDDLNDKINKMRNEAVDLSNNVSNVHDRYREAVQHYEKLGY